jgi:hypothetical protein
MLYFYEFYGIFYEYSNVKWIIWEIKSEINLKNKKSWNSDELFSAWGPALLA